MKRSQRPRGKVAPVRRALIGLLLGSCMLAVGEFACRFFDKAWDQLSPSDPYWVTFLGERRVFPRLLNPPNGASRRIFCIGGSVTAGFPFPFAGYPEWMSKELDRCGAPGRFQVLNRGMGSWGSRREESLVRQVLDESPWAVVLYMGHNEVGEEMLYRSIPAWARSPIGRWSWRSAGLTTLARFVVREKEQLSGAKDPQGAWGWPKFLIPLAPQDVEQDFEGRLRRIVKTIARSGVIPIVCVSPSNLYFPPIRSNDADMIQANSVRGESAEWIRIYASALDLWRRRRPGSALAQLRTLPEAARTDSVHWLMGMCLLEMKQFERGRTELRLSASKAWIASDRLREIQRRVASEEGAVLVDLDKLWSARSPARLPEARYFSDNHHLSLLGYRSAGRAVLEALNESKHLPAPCPKPELAERADIADLGLPRKHEAAAWGLMANEYSFYGDQTGDAEFHRQAVDWMVRGLRLDPPGCLSRLRLDHPAIMLDLALAYARLRDSASSRMWIDRVRSSPEDAWLGIRKFDRSPWAREARKALGIRNLVK